MALLEILTQNEQKLFDLPPQFLSVEDRKNYFKLDEALNVIVDNLRGTMNKIGFILCIKNLHQKIKKNVPNKDISIGDDIILPVPKGLPEQQTQFSLVATSSMPSPARALIFSMESKLKDTLGSIIIPHQNLAKFLKHVGFGEQDEAENMLKQDPSLSLKFGNLTDCAEREFKKISAFQYALWALDFHMWQMILKYLSPEEAIKQVAGLKNGAWVKIYGIKVDWQNLIDALQNHIDNYRSRSSNQCLTYWCQQVGGAQLLLPAHVINEYSHPSRPLYPWPYIW